MPFTFSHPAIVIPILKRFPKWISPTGLIIGSLLPDFEYFIRMTITSEFSHTLIGVLWFNLPLGVILCYFFHQIIKIPLVNNSPLFIQTRLLNYSNVNWHLYFKNNYRAVLFSLLIGVLTHIIWDSFTHHNAYFVIELSLDKTFLLIPIFKYLQHLSTIIGGLYICIEFLKLPKKTITSTKINVLYWIGTMLITLIGLYFRFNQETISLGNFIVSLIAIFILSIGIVSLIYSFLKS